MAKKIKQYGSKDPGLSLSLGSLEEYYFKTYGKRRIVFPAHGSNVRLIDEGNKGKRTESRPAVYVTDDPKIQEFIEAHPFFEQEILFPVPTAEDIAEQKKAEEQKQFLAHLAKAKEIGVFSTKGLSDAKLKELADQTGVDTGKASTPAGIAKAIEAAVDAVIQAAAPAA